MRTAYKVRAYPSPEQAVMLSRTFGCVRVVWNRTRAPRLARYAWDKTSTSYRESDAGLTAPNKDPELTWPAGFAVSACGGRFRRQGFAFRCHR
jgi:putative transposase